MKYLQSVAYILILLVFIGVGVKYAATNHNKLELKEIQLKDTHSNLIQLQTKYDKLNHELKRAKSNGHTSKKKLEELKKHKEKLEQEKKDLEAKLISKRKTQRAADKAIDTATGTRTAHAAKKPAGSTQCLQWVKQAGIKDVSNAMKLIDRESDCNPNAVNPSSGACGIAQFIDGCQTHDPVQQLKRMKAYVLSRYGSFANAINFHYRNNYY